MYKPLQILKRKCTSCDVKIYKDGYIEAEIEYTARRVLADRGEQDCHVYRMMEYRLNTLLFTIFGRDYLDYTTDKRLMGKNDNSIYTMMSYIEEISPRGDERSKLHKAIKAYFAKALHLPLSRCNIVEEVK